MVYSRSIVLILTLALMGLSACQECEEHANCTKSCDCLDSATDTTSQCAITFLCERESRSCEAAYEEDCNSFCGTYAGNQVCGSQRCLLDTDCVRTAECIINATDGSTQPCSLQFLCDSGLGVCEAAYILDDTSFCGLCLANATSG